MDRAMEKDIEQMTQLKDCPLTSRDEWNERCEDAKTRIARQCPRECYP